MKPRKNFILIMLIALLLAAFAVAAAQTPAQGDDKKKAETCCAMESSGDAKDSCACCDESCDMAKHDANMKHDKDHKDHKGDCCKMKQKDKTKEKKVA